MIKNTQIQNYTCQKDGHQGNQIIGMCVENNCDSNDLVCFKCLIPYHQSHIDSIIPLNDFISIIQENQNTISLSCLGNLPILSEHSKEKLLLLEQKKQDLTLLKDQVIKGTEQYLNQQIISMEDQINEMQSNSTMSIIQQNIEKIEPNNLQNMSYQEISDIFSFFRPLIQKENGQYQKFAFVQEQPNFKSDMLDKEVEQLLKFQQQKLFHLKDILNMLQIGFDDRQSPFQSVNQSVNKLSMVKFNTQQQQQQQQLNPQNFNINNLNQRGGLRNNRQSVIKQTPSQSQMMNNLMLKQQPSIIKSNLGNGMINEEEEINNQIQLHQQKILQKQIEQQNRLEQQLLEQQQKDKLLKEQQLKEQQLKEMQLKEQQQKEEQEKQEKLQQQQLIQSLQPKYEEIVQKSQNRLQLKTLEYFTDALKVESLQTWAISFKINCEQETAQIKGFKHFPIYIHENTVYDSLQQAQLDVYIIEGNVIQLGKKIYNQKFILKKSQKDSTEDDFIEELNFSQNVNVKKDEIYSLVIVNITEEQLENDEKRLFILTGDQQVNEQLEDEEQKLQQSKLEYIDSDFTNIQHFLEIDGIESSQLKNEREEEEDNNQQEFFIQNILYSVQNEITVEQQKEQILLQQQQQKQQKQQQQSNKKNTNQHQQYQQQQLFQQNQQQLQQQQTIGSDQDTPLRINNNINNSYRRNSSVDMKIDDDSLPLSPIASNNQSFQNFNQNNNNYQNYNNNTELNNNNNSFNSQYQQNSNNNFSKSKYHQQNTQVDSQVIGSNNFMNMLDFSQNNSQQENMMNLNNFNNNNNNNNNNQGYSRRKTFNDRGGQHNQSNNNFINNMMKGYPNNKHKRQYQNNNNNSNNNGNSKNYNNFQNYNSGQQNFYPNKKMKQ